MENGDDRGFDDPAAGNAGNAGNAWRPLEASPAGGMMVREGMPETEHPGIFVEETDGKPKPIEGVPTDALTAADRWRWLIGLVIAAIVLVGLGFWFTR